MAQPILSPSGRQLTDEEKQKIAQPITEGLQELIGGNPGLFINRPAFIADEPSGNPFIDTVRAISRFNCRTWALSDKSRYSPGVNNTNAALCNPYLASIFEQPEDGDVGPQFSGGQCPVFYDFTYRITSNTIPNPINQSIRRSGPLSVNIVDDGPGSRGILLRHRFSQPEGEGLASGSRQDNTGISVVSVVRVDGLPDNCGNAPIDYREPSRPTPVTPLPPEITVNIPGIGPVSVTVTLDDDGNPTICYTEIDLCVSIPIGEGEGGGSGGGEEPPPQTEGDGPSTPGEAGNGADTGSGGDASGQAAEGDELVGVLVEVLEAPGSPNTFDNNSQTVYRGIGYVRMGYPNRLGVDISGGTVISPQFFHAQQRGLTNWAVNANLGFNLRNTPYYRPIGETEK